MQLEMTVTATAAPALAEQHWDLPSKDLSEEQHFSTS